MSVPVELGLSVFATVISLLGLILHFVRFRREKPSLYIEGISRMHYPFFEKVKHTQLGVAFYVHNRGDRAPVPTREVTLLLRMHRALKCSTQV